MTLSLQNLTPVKGYYHVFPIMFFKLGLPCFRCFPFLILLLGKTGTGVIRPDPGSWPCAWQCRRSGRAGSRTLWKAGWERCPPSTGRQESPELGATRRQSSSPQHRQEPLPGCSPRVWSQVGLERERERDPVPLWDLCRLRTCPLQLVSSASPLSVEVVNFTQMEKPSRAPAPKGVCDGFLGVTDARGWWPYLLRLLPPVPARPYSAGLFCHLSFAIPHICAARGRARAPPAALAEAALVVDVCVGKIKERPDNGDVVPASLHPGWGKEPAPPQREPRIPATRRAGGRMTRE